MKKFILIFGPPAVGKMTVGQELSKITGLKLLHNHMTIDLVQAFFQYGSESYQRLLRLIRIELLSEIANSNLGGLIFTKSWRFNVDSDSEFIRTAAGIFMDSGAEVYYVELEADFDERIRRNKSENRLHHKMSKRNVELSEATLYEDSQRYVTNTSENMKLPQHYIKINSTHLTAKETAVIISKHIK